MPIDARHGTINGLLLCFAAGSLPRRKCLTPRLCIQSQAHLKSHCVHPPFDGAALAVTSQSQLRVSFVLKPFADPKMQLQESRSQPAAHCRGYERGLTYRAWRLTGIKARPAFIQAIKVLDFFPAVECPCIRIQRDAL